MATAKTGRLFTESRRASATPPSQGTSFPQPNQFHAHGYVNEMNDAVDCALDPDRFPQSGPLMAWDTMAVLMAAYESSDKNAVFINLTEYLEARTFDNTEIPNPEKFGTVFQKL